MEIFGFSAAKILLILTIAVVLFGPDKVPEMAAQVGRLIRDFRRYTQEMTREFNEATGGLRDEFTTIAQDLRGELEETQKDLRRQLDLTDIFGETSEAVASRKAAGGVDVGSTVPAPHDIVDDPEPSPAAPVVPAADDVVHESLPSMEVAQTIDRLTPHATRTDPLADLGILASSLLAGKSPGRAVGRSMATSRYVRRTGASGPRQALPVRPARKDVDNDRGTCRVTALSRPVEAR
jgi:sec-independent protein translocase protein TatB